MELVDTPGVGSVFAHNSAEAAAVLDTMDAAVLVLTADPPLSASERDLPHAVRGRSVALFVALQRALATAQRDLIRAVEHRYTDAVAGLVRALVAATDLARAADVAGRRADLGAQITRLRRLSAELDTLDTQLTEVAHGD